MPDRYGVIGQPVAHSKSPQIHAAFARQTGQPLEYLRIEGRADDFEAQVHDLPAHGYRGLNVTLPFKERALRLADRSTARARLAGAANTLLFSEAGCEADNTDGIGFMRDLEGRLDFSAGGRRVLVLGAGGAVRGILAPLLATRPAALRVHNRTHQRALALVSDFQGEAAPGVLCACDADALRNEAPFDLVINGSSASLSGTTLALPSHLFAAHCLAYDLAYRADGATPFMQGASAAGAARCVDGLGMLVEQAAEAFLRWRGIAPETDAVLAGLRAGSLTDPAG